MARQNRDVLGTISERGTLRWNGSSVGTSRVESALLSPRYQGPDWWLRPPARRRSASKRRSRQGTTFLLNLRL